MTDVPSIVSGAAQRYGQDPALMLRMGQIESSLNPAAYNADSGASGLFQFTKSTAKAYGLADPQDPAANADAAARLLRDNRAALTKALGRDPSGPELYLAHQQGAGGAAKLLANPDAPAVSLVGTRAVIQNGGQQGMTGRQFADMWTSRFGGAATQRPSMGTLFAAPPPASSVGAQQPAPVPAIAPSAALPDLPASESIPGVAAPAAAQQRRSRSAELRKRALVTGDGALGALFA